MTDHAQRLGPSPVVRGGVGGLLHLPLALVLLCLLLAPGRASASSPGLPTTAVWPLTGAVRVIRGFDPPDSPYGHGHRGVDLAAPVGSSVLAAAAGRVTFAGVLAGRGVVVVDHGSVRTTYEPVSGLVGVGAEVSAGQVIGRLSAGGHCGSTPCLHWGLLRGKTYLDPLSLGVGPAPQPVRVELLPASAPDLARRRAVARAAAAAAYASASAQLAHLNPTAGRHGFAHPVPGAITSGFGRRFHPVLKVWKLHDGTDFGAPCGTPIRAPYAGVVSRTADSRAYGHRLFLDHGEVDGRHVVTSYNHAARYVVRVGTRVDRGQVLGFVGRTGYATGCHLHLMVWLDGRLTNPVTWF